VADSQIIAKCPKCGKEHKVPRERIGRKGKCSCGNVFVVQEPPTAAEMIACASCGARVYVTERTCPACGKSTRQGEEQAEPTEGPGTAASAASTTGRRPRRVLVIGTVALVVTSAVLAFLLLRDRQELPRGEIVALPEVNWDSCPSYLAPCEIVPLPDDWGETLDEARQSNCAGNLKQLALAHLMYSQDYDETFCPHKDWRQLIYGYFQNWALVHCPSDPSAGLNCSYEYNELVAGKSLKELCDRFGDPDEMPLLWDREIFHQGSRNCAFVDGPIAVHVAVMLYESK